MLLNGGRQELEHGSPSFLSNFENARWASKGFGGCLKFSSNVLVMVYCILMEACSQLDQHLVYYVKGSDHGLFCEHLSVHLFPT